MNFDVWIDFVAFMFILTGIAFLGLALVGVLQGPDTPLFPTGDESDSTEDDSTSAEDEDEAEAEAETEDDDAADDADEQED